ncbi:MAG TPA: VOC family protein [Devosiaceae bacterium]|jgi:catechol 2,3-dioxygenase-like lactoylglutathione lyase family enzyme|nr:VOC family protein [Devosiaceae bacterium]
MTGTRIHRVSIPVSDQDRAKAFYTGTMGFELKGDMPVPMGENARWIEVAPPGQDASLVLTTWLGMQPGSLRGIMLETADLDDQLTRLKRDGVTVDGPHDTPWGRQASFADPDGNEFVLAAAATAAT